MRIRLFCLLLLASFAVAAQLTATAQPRASLRPAANAQPVPTFDIFYSSARGGERLTGRMFLIFAHSDSVEPRLQVGRYGTQFFGVDFVDLPPDHAVHIDGMTLGYPINEMAAIPPGDYYVQAVLDRYTEFKRSDGHTLWMHMDQWEGQDWRRSPGNLYSAVQKITIGGTNTHAITFTVDQVMPAIPQPADTKWVKHIKMKSQKLTAFWGQPIYIGATILLPKGYEANPGKHYPTIYQEGHFSIGAPFGFREDASNDFSKDWASDSFPPFIAVTIQHPSPYFDDSYAVNSANNGPYGDAIQEELIPEIERQFRCVPQGYARLLTGGSTGGWESFALQVLYPDFYGGCWAFSPDPLDFNNVEGINIYKDQNAFYKQHEWYRAPTPNTRVPATGEVMLTSAQRNTMELVNGTHGRSGGQLDIWSAVFGPVGSDGYFKPLFNKSTGVIDSSVALYWRNHFDMLYYLQHHWAEVGPKLVGKLHVFAGRMDDFYLNIAVYHMEDFLSATKDPYYNGSFMYGDRGGHGWRPCTTGQLIRNMAAYLRQNGH
ncbi:MAG TPA: alpha/beta hydrolase-fold protein [Puia sp.]|nr:alpha/beta hydrolase-fold protein [Puia sp.]